MPLGEATAVRGTVTSAGGSVKHAFAQGTDLRNYFQQIAVSDAAGDNRDLRDGICKSLCFEWLGRRAKGSSLWDFLAKGGAAGIFAEQQTYYDKTDRNVQELAAGSRVNIAGMATTYDGAKRAATDQALAQRGLKLLVRDSGAIPQDSSQGALAVGKALSKQQGYVLMTLAHGAAGHAICALVDNGITFFDPNYGEFSFAKIGTGAPRDHSPNTFLVWMPYFWKASNYHQVFGGGSYIVSDYHA